jgi:hypothetical protein
VVYWFVTPCSLIGEYQCCSGKCCLHVQSRSAEYDTNVIHDIVRLRGSSMESGWEIKSGTGHKEGSTSPATIGRPWNLTTWTTTCLPYSLRPEVEAERYVEALISRDKLPGSLDIQRQTTHKPWYSKTNYTVALIAKDKQKPQYPATNYTQASMSRNKLHKSLNVQRQNIQKP